MEKFFTASNFTIWKGSSTSKYTPYHSCYKIYSGGEDRCTDEYIYFKPVEIRNTVIYLPVKYNRGSMARDYLGRPQFSSSPYLFGTYCIPCQL